MLFHVKILIQITYYTRDIEDHSNSRFLAQVELAFLSLGGGILYGTIEEYKNLKKLYL